MRAITILYKNGSIKNGNHGDNRNSSDDSNRRITSHGVAPGPRESEMSLDRVTNGAVRSQPAGCCLVALKRSITI